MYCHLVYGYFESFRPLASREVSEKSIRRSPLQDEEDEDDDEKVKLNKSM